MNKLPENWCVRNDGSKLFKNTVIRYLNDKFRNQFRGDSSNYYYGINDGHNVSKPLPWNRQLSLEQFIEMTTEWIPEEGELVEVSTDNTNWHKRIFLFKDKNDNIACVTDGYETNYIEGNNNRYIYTIWFFIRKIEEPKTIDVTIEEIAKLKGVKPEQIRIKE